MLFKHIVICRCSDHEVLACVLVFDKKSKDNRSHFLAQNRVQYNVVGNLVLCIEEIYIS